MVEQIQNKIVHKIAFTGKMGAGKGAAAVLFPGIVSDVYGAENVRAWIFSFAWPLKQCARIFHQNDVKKPRIFLQRLGDLARREFGEDIMDRILTENVQGLITNVIPNVPQKHIVIMCDDLRFLTEYELLKKMGFTVVCVEADEKIRQQRLGDTFTNANHRSEMEMKLFEPDIVIFNNINEPQMPTFERHFKDTLVKQGWFETNGQDN